MSTASEEGESNSLGNMLGNDWGTEDEGRASPSPEDASTEEPGPMKNQNNQTGNSDLKTSGMELLMRLKSMEDGRESNESQEDLEELEVDGDNVEEGDASDVGEEGNERDEEEEDDEREPLRKENPTNEGGKRNGNGNKRAGMAATPTPAPKRHRPNDGGKAKAGETSKKFSKPATRGKGKGRAKAGTRATDNEEEHDEDEEVGIEDAFPAASTITRNQHSEYTDRQLIEIMGDGRKKRTKLKLWMLASDVWNKKGNLKKDYKYLMRLPESSNPNDYMTSEEKLAYINKTPKAERDIERFDTLLNAKGEVRKRRKPDFVQPRKEGTTLMESPVYRPEGVLPSKAKYAEALREATMAEPSAKNLGINRLKSQRAEVVNKLRETYKEKEDLHKLQEQIRKETVKHLKTKDDYIHQLEETLQEKDIEMGLWVDSVREKDIEIETLAARIAELEQQRSDGLNGTCTGAQEDTSQSGIGNGDPK
ncbi:MAG: hypothetical protein M1823_003840 [Watsoniomyces obsoletus]|nr:MAG: hypothetical protein M1823_003840 [Watsoniomyces obsoletus]